MSKAEGKTPIERLIAFQYRNFKIGSDEYNELGHIWQDLKQEREKWEKELEDRRVYNDMKLLKAYDKWDSHHYRKLKKVPISDRISVFLQRFYTDDGSLFDEISLEDIVNAHFLRK